MKRLLACLLAAAMTAAIAGCTSPAAQSASVDSAPVDLNSMGEIGGDITVSCYDTMLSQPLLEEAKQKFEQAYPGANVIIETHSAMPEIKAMEDEDGGSYAIAMADDNPQAVTDYINKVSTELMSGAGADLLAMDVLPYHRYVANNQLEDLSGYMSADSEWNPADYRQNILEAAKYNGGQYFLPLDYAFEYYAYDSTLLEPAAAQALGGKGALTLQQLLDAASPTMESGTAHKLIGMSGFSASGESLFHALLAERRAQFINQEDGTAHFDTGEFAALLESVKALADKGYLMPAADMSGEGAGAEMFDMFQANADERFVVKRKDLFSLVQAHSEDNGDVAISFGNLAGVEKDDEIVGLPANADGAVPFTFTQGYALNANSANKQTAWAFLKFLMSEEMQSSANLMPFNLALHNGARAKKNELLISGAIFGGGEPQALTAAQREAYEKYTAQVEAFSDQINACIPPDTALDELILTECAAYFGGGKSAEEVAQAVQSKAELYLNE